jgi:hypothetical protein
MKHAGHVSPLLPGVLTSNTQINENPGRQPGEGSDDESTRRSHETGSLSVTPHPIRKIVTFIDDTLEEGGRATARPIRMAGCAAVVRNPWAGAAFVDNLRPGITAYAAALGDTLVPRLVDLFPDADAIEAFGKCAVVGVNGEIEHAAAMIHTLHFGNRVRIGTRGDSFMFFTNKRNGAGGAVILPLTHKTSELRGSRSHFLTLEFAIPDAPGPDEIVVAIGASDGGRPHSRIGDRYIDMKEMGVDQTGKPLTAPA